MRWITRIGRVLRRTRLDELPQLWNILIGNMSLVGPRPERPEFVQELTRQIPLYKLRHVVKPGLTGWAQVRYTYTATVEDTMEKLQHDLFYIKNLSLRLDLFIIFETVKTVVLHRGRYRGVYSNDPPRAPTLLWDAALPREVGPRRTERPARRRVSRPRLKGRAWDRPCRCNRASGSGVIDFTKFGEVVSEVVIIGGSIRL